MAMKRSVLALGAASLALAALGGAALAQQKMGAMGGHDPFGNATITRAEAQAKATEMFARLDVNGDGKLDAADRTAAMAKRFDAMDANHDGMLSKQEFLDAHQAMRDGMMKAHGGPGGPGERPMGEHRIGGGMRAMHGMMMLRTMDANGDKAISRDEFIAGALKRFDAADANHDGKLTPEERHAAMRQGKMKHRQQMGGMHHDMGAMGDMPPPPPK